MEDTASDVCSVFEGFMDFLSAVTLGIGGNGDSLVLNSGRQRGEGGETSGRVRTHRLFLDRDEAGRGRWKPERTRYGERVLRPFRL